MKFLTLHTNGNTKLVLNPWGVSFAQQRVGESGMNSFVFAGGTAFLVAETVDEIETMINACVRDNNGEGGMK